MYGILILLGPDSWNTTVFPEIKLQRLPSVHGLIKNLTALLGSVAMLEQQDAFIIL